VTIDGVYGVYGTEMIREPLTRICNKRNVAESTETNLERHW